MIQAKFVKNAEASVKYVCPFSGYGCSIVAVAGFGA
jgi:hypothetical protein